MERGGERWRDSEMERDGQRGRMRYREVTGSTQTVSEQAGCVQFT